MKTMKRFLAMMVALILAVSCMSVSAFAADSISVSATVNAATAKPGDTIEVVVSASSASFAGYSMKLGYDSSALKLVSVTKNAANNPGLFSGNANTGVVSMVNDVDFAASGTLFTAKFEVLAGAADGTYTVSLGSASFTKASTERLTTSASGTSVTVKAPHTHSYDKVVTAPTCTAEGYTTYTCACGKSYTDDYKDALDHKWDNGTVTTPATEGKPGVRTYKCTVCGDTKTEEIPALDHTHKYTSTVKAPTCTEKGITTYTCTCGESYQADEKAALGHKWDNGTVKAPTCEEKGSTTYKCATCGETKTEETAALGHKWEKGAVTEPTCDKKGSTAYKCSACGETKSEEIAALGHKWDNGTVTTKPTCTEKGSTTYKCTACGETKTEATSALGHKWGNGTVTVEPTQDTAGSRTYKCSVCGETKTETIAALSHTHENTSVVTAPTCTEQGYTTYTCTSCGETSKGDYVDAKGHSYATTWSWSDDYSTASLKMVCKNCLNAVAVKGEDVTIKVETTQPQKGVDGKTVYTASAVVEGKTFSDAKTVVIPASEAGGGSAGLYIGIGVAVIVIAAGAVVVLKKKKKVA